MSTIVGSNLHSDPAGDIPHIDVRDAAFRFDQPDIMAARERHWYARTAMGPLVLRYDDVAGLLADRRLSPTGAGHVRVHGITAGPIHDYFAINISSRPAADHGQVRALLAPFLRPLRLDQARTAATSIADRLLAGLAEYPECDFMSGFADPLTIEVFCGLFGIPIEDYPRFGPWSADVGLVFGLTLDGLRARVEEDMASLFSYFEDLLERRRVRGTGDFVSSLVRAEAEQGISEQQCLSTLVSLIMGGHDAPMHQLGCAVLTLAQHPDQWRLLGERPELAGQAVEEALRWSAHTHTMRFALSDLAYRDVELAAGELLITCNSAANRDPRAFDRPDEFDITAKRRRLAIAFGGGPYFCPGNALARMELEVALVALTGRFPPPEVTGDVRWRPPTTTAYGPETLPLRFRP